MWNTVKCGDCVHYDPVLGPGERHINKGWCIKRSLYPSHEGPGQMFPPHAKRVKVGELAQPFIVRKDQCVLACQDVQQNFRDSVKSKREGQTTRDKDGKRVLE